MLSDIPTNQTSSVGNLETDNVQNKNFDTLSSGRIPLKPLNQNISRVQPFRVAKQV